MGNVSKGQHPDQEVKKSTKRPPTDLQNKEKNAHPDSDFRGLLDKCGAGAKMHRSYTS